VQEVLTDLHREPDSGDRDNIGRGRRFSALAFPFGMIDAG
jgi:hypothetical protein